MAPLPNFSNIKISHSIRYKSDEEQRNVTKAKLIEIFKKDMSLFNEITADFRKEKIEKIKRGYEKEQG